jgi:putative ABC transport system substrate-binding protein
VRGSAPVPRIGYLGQSPTDTLDAFRQGLLDHNHHEGQNIVVEYRFSEGNADRLPALADELVHLNLDVIVATHNPAAAALRRSTDSIPIVMVGDPVVTGLAASFARPGGNVTGLSNLSEGLGAKQVELLTAIVPNADRLALLANPDNPNAAQQSQEARLAAAGIGLTIKSIEARNPDELTAAIDTATLGWANALLVLHDPFLQQQRQRITSAALANRLPSMYLYKAFVVAGGLVSYGPSQLNVQRRTVFYVDKILKGARPADLPVEQPTQFEFVANSTTAQLLGITLPPAVASQVTEWVA